MGGRSPTSLTSPKARDPVPVPVPVAAIRFLQQLLIILTCTMQQLLHVLLSILAASASSHVSRTPYHRSRNENITCDTNSTRRYKKCAAPRKPLKGLLLCNPSYISSCILYASPVWASP